MNKASVWIAATLLAGAAAAQTSHYTVTDMGTLGGTNANSYDMNAAGWVGGSSNLTPGGPQHAFLWFGAHLRDLGTLGGTACPNCNSEAGGPNAAGEAALISETAEGAYLGEDFCQFGTHLQCLAAIWLQGKLSALPTLPNGHNAQAYGLNNQGSVVGFSENGEFDTTCATATPFQMNRFQAVIWGTKGQMRELKPLRSEGDTVAFAFGINDKGQAVGSSGTCDTQGLPPLYVNGLHAVLWQSDGTAVDLGNLGGNGMPNVASSINDRGQVAGTSVSTDGTPHPFLWTSDGGMQDLGGFPGAFATINPCCNALNNKGKVVGFYFDANGQHPYIWDQKLIDLNTLIPANSGLYLLSAVSINDAGQITGQACVMPACTEFHGYLLTPRN